MKFLKKFLPVMVIVTILLSVAIIPASAAESDVSAYEGRWYKMDMSAFDTTVGIIGSFYVPSYDYLGSGSFLFDFSRLVHYNQIYYRDGILYGVNDYGDRRPFNENVDIFPWYRFIFVESLYSGYTWDTSPFIFNTFDNFDPCLTFTLDSYTIPYPDGADFNDITYLIPNFKVGGSQHYVTFKSSVDSDDEYVYGKIGTDFEIVEGGGDPLEYGAKFTISPSNSGGILSGFGVISSWIVSSLGSLNGIFFANGALTPLGILCIFGLAIGLAFLLFNVVKNFLEMRS